MKKLPLYLIFLLFILLQTAFSQENTVSGIVLDKRTEMPLEGANVYFKDAGIGTLTDEDGYFRLTYRPSENIDSLTVSFVGYKDYTIAFKSLKNRSKIYLEPDALNLPEIIVSADRLDIIRQEIPQTKRTIQVEEIKRYGSNEFSDILKPLPSVRIEGNDLDGRKIQIRGSDPDEVNVYLDGVLLNHVRFDNAADLSVIPVEAVERIEILNGGNSAFLGNGAFGGVVNITTRRVNKKSLSLKAKAGSFDSNYFIGDLTMPIGKKMALGYFGQYNTMRPDIEYFQDEQYAEKTTNSSINTKKQNHIVSLNYWIPAGFFGSQFIAYDFDYKKPNWTSNYRTFSSSVTYKGNIVGLKDFDILLNHIYAQDKINRLPEGSSRYITNFESNLVNMRIAKKFSYRGGETQLLAEYFHDGLLTSSKIEDINWQNTIYSGDLYDNRLGFSWVSSFNDKLKNHPDFSWKTYLGIRGEMLASGESDMLPMIGAQVEYQRAGLNLSIYGNYGKNVKYPSLQKNAYVRDIVSISQFDTSFTNLKPEYSNSTEFGTNLKYLPGSSFYGEADVSASVFSRTIYNKILTRPFDDYIASIQSGRNITRGVETSVKINDIFSRFNLSLAYVYLDISNPLVYAYKPDQNFNASFSYVSPLGIYFVSSYFYEGKSLAWYYDVYNQFQTQEITPFQDIDASIGIKLPFHTVIFDLQFSGYNILDNAGFKYYYLRKRYFQMSLGIRY